MVEVIISVIAAFLSLLAGGIASTDLIRKRVHRILGKPEPEKTYSERLSKLTHSLSNASAEVDTLLSELGQVAREKEISVRELEKGITALEHEELELQDRIEVLENVSIPAVEHFARLMEPGEKRSTMRDYFLFGAGVIFTTVITIVIQVFL